MVTRPAVMLAALSVRTSAFSYPLITTAGTRYLRAHGHGFSTRVSRLLAVGTTEVEGRPEVLLGTGSEMPNVKSSFLQTLVERGFYHQCTDVAGLDKKLSSGELVKAYLGFDATADR